MTNCSYIMTADGNPVIMAVDCKSLHPVSVGQQSPQMDSDLGPVSTVSEMFEGTALGGSSPHQISVVRLATYWPLEA